MLLHAAFFERGPCLGFGGGNCAFSVDFCSACQKRLKLTCLLTQKGGEHLFVEQVVALAVFVYEILGRFFPRLQEKLVSHSSIAQGIRSGII